MAHSAPVPRLGRAAAALGLTVVLSACGSVRTELPATVSPAPPLDAVPADSATIATLASSEAAPATQASEYKSPGEKHALPGGTVAASYPRVGVRPPKGVEAAPAGQAWAVLNVRFCAAAQGPLDGRLVDPNRFRVEVPGQGYLTPAPDAPALARAPLAAGTVVSAGTCTEGSIAYLVAGEGHIESITYDADDILLRWAT